MIKEIGMALLKSNAKTLEDAMELANITSGISVLRVGGRYSIPSLEEVINYVR